MPDYVTRTTFYDGQILGASDLNLAGSSLRDALARHLRYQHSPGIVTGLELSGEDRTTSGAGGTETSYKEVTLEAGVAVDGTGRAIVVTETTRVPESLFIDLGVAISDPEAWYPVFLYGRDTEAREQAGPSGACQTAAANRVAEVFEVTFGRLSELDNLDAQQTVDVTDGAGSGSASPWRVLLGFVQWDESIGKFTNVADQAEGIGRRYAGVHAGEVTGAGGVLFLRCGERTLKGAPAVKMSSGDLGQLQFGLQNSLGEITPVMTVDSDGNLKVTGKIVGALAGGVQVESGIASDGMLLPLPAGITQEGIDQGEVVIQAHVTPRFQVPARFDPAEKWFPHFYECRVDGRRVRCRVRWISTIAPPPAPIDLPGVCDYVLMAFSRNEGDS